ncbi:MAG: transcription elongation factor GreA [Candidatus Bruticola sp.]
MANEKTNYLTRQGLIEAQQKLQYLKTTKREQIAERIRVAREFGDISENAEYESAKAEQGFVEGTISELERVLQNYTIIGESADDGGAQLSEVNLGTLVTIVNMDLDENGQEERYSLELVGTRETNPQGGRISNECPLGAALLHHGLGDIVDVKTPSGVISWKIEKIQPVGIKNA